jgi:hypothetical protein
MSTTEIISVIFSILSCSFAGYQIFKMDKIKKLQRRHCESRCKNIVSLTREMTNEVIGACKAFNDEMEELQKANKKPNFNMPQIAAKISSINVLTGRLIDFCTEINDEHESEFGYKVFPDIKIELPEHQCLITAKNKLAMNIQNEIK